MNNRVVQVLMLYRLALIWTVQMLRSRWQPRVESEPWMKEPGPGRSISARWRDTTGNILGPPKKRAKTERALVVGPTLSRPLQARDRFPCLASPLKTVTAEWTPHPHHTIAFVHMSPMFTTPAVDRWHVNGSGSSILLGHPFNEPYLKYYDIWRSITLCLDKKTAP